MGDAENLSEDSVVIQKNGHQVVISGAFKEATFQRNLKRYKYKEKLRDALDEKNEYVLNNCGHRGPDFKPGIELLAAGCSQTYGVGVPEQGSWPALLAKELGMSYANLSAPGASIEWIVQSLFTYFHEFGNPKVLAVLVPDLFRMEVVLNHEINSSREVSVRDLPTQGIDDDFLVGVVTFRSVELDINWRAKLSKRPFNIEDTIPPEEAVYRNFKHLMMLEEYCKAAGIKLVWTSWSDDVNRFIEEYSDRNYFESSFSCDELFYWASDGKQEHWELEQDYKLNHGSNPECLSENTSDACICYDYECHRELEELYPDAFHFGTDRYKRGVGNSHFGVHRHAHVAMSFSKQILSAIDSKE